MKRKLALIILVLTCAIACAFGLSACGGGGGGGGGKTVSGLVMIDGDGTEYYEYDLGDIVYGMAAPDFSGIKLYAKYSDGTKRELGEADADDVEIEYSYNNEILQSAPTNLTVGIYGMRYTYENYSVSVRYSIVTSAQASPYSIVLDKTTWKYGEEPTITVRDRSQNEIDSSEYSVQYLGKNDYEEIKNADNFIELLQQKANNVYANTVDGEVYADIVPGEYYFFAFFSGYVRANSTMQKVTINKGTLTPEFADDFAVTFSNNWWTYGEVGKIAISKIGLDAGYDKVTWKDANGKPYEQPWYPEWVNPDEQIDSSINGQRRQIKFVFGDNTLYEAYVVVEPVTIKFDKNQLSVPTVTEEEYNFNVINYDGADHDVFFRYNGAVSNYDIEKLNNILTIKDSDGNVITIGEGGKLATLCDDGVYTFTFELKDKVNYEWRYVDYDAEGEPYVEDTVDKTYEFTIRPLAFWFNPFPNKNYYDVPIDENRQIVLKVETGTDEDTSGSSPYKAGTLQATILSEYIFNGYTYTSNIDATVTVESRADGYDYIVITVTDFKELPNNYSGALLLKVTAKGDNHYADIERVFENLSISRYSFADTAAVTCPLKGMLDNDTMEQPAGITVAKLYETYPELTNELGKWSLEYDYNDNGAWMPLGDAATLPQTTLKCRLVFKSDFVNNVDQIAVYEFTLIGTPNN